MNINALLEFLHKGQQRKTGDAYTSHLYEVHNILRKAGIKDKDLLDAALLHDVLEDTYISKDYLRLRFGERVAEIVDIVSKESFWNTKYLQMKGTLDEMEERWTDYPEAVLIKIADRLHNLQTIHGFKKEKRKEYMNETKELLVPMFQTVIHKKSFGRFQKPAELLIKKMEKEIVQIEKHL